jgi:hypothetical protein
MSMSDGAAASVALELTLRGVHKLRIARDGAGLKIGVENLDTGDMFGRTLVPGDLVALVPERLERDVESLDDFEVRVTRLPPNQ